MSKPEKHIVIIGHGPGGMTAAGFAMRTDRKAKITIFDKRSYDIYHPCSQPYVIGENLSLDAIMEKAGYTRRVTLRLNSEVTEISPDEKKIKVKGPEGEEEVIGWAVFDFADGKYNECIYVFKTRKGIREAGFFNDVRRVAIREV